MQDRVLTLAFILCIALLGLVNTQAPSSFMAWSAFVEPACAATPTFDYTTPLGECFNASNVPFNPFNLTNPYLLVTENGKQLVGNGCEDAACGKCPATETITIGVCSPGQWLGNTTAYFSYSVLNGLIPQSKFGGIIYQYYAPTDSSCSGESVGANIQENGVCTYGMLA